jgi:hypothetical protein
VEWSHGTQNTIVEQVRHSMQTHEPSDKTSMAHGATVGGVRGLLRLEGAAALALFLTLYAQGGHGWGYFAAGFLTPDLAMLGYLHSARVGAWLYNAAHTYLGPLALLGLGWVGEQVWAVPIGLIWASHVAFDRMLGYGLKYERGFSFTHLGQVGFSARTRP